MVDERELKSEIEKAKEELRKESHQDLDRVQDQIQTVSDNSSAQPSNQSGGMKYHVKRVYKKISDIELYVHSGWMSVFFVFCLIFFLHDLASWWSPTFVPWWTGYTRFMAWLTFSVSLAFVMIFITSESDNHLYTVLFCVKHFLYTLLPVYAHQVLVNNSDAILNFIPAITPFSHFLFNGVTPAMFLFAYLVSGWPKFFLAEEQHQSGALGSVARFFYKFTFIVMFILVFFPLILIAGAYAEDAASTVNYETPLKDQFDEFYRITGFNLAFWRAPPDAGEPDPDAEEDDTPCTWWPVSNWQNCLSDLQGRVNPVPETEYTARVDRHANQRLGVYVENQRPLLEPYRFVKQDDILSIPPNQAYRSFDWSGDLVSSIVADQMDVELFCEYQYIDGEGEKVTVPEQNEVSATPESLRVFYSQGAEDINFFSCSLPAASVLDTGKPQGQFLTRAVYDFETWGYATVSFMSQEEFLAIRAQNQDPARAIGVDRTLIAYYTPGPVSLGMFDRLTLPRPVDLNTTAINNWPAFGVTLQNSWTRGRGRVSQVEHLIFQVPEPFVLDTANCLGFFEVGSTSQTSERPPRLQNRIDGYNYIEGYNFYIAENLQFGEDVRSRTFTCPIILDSGSTPSDVLGENLNPQQHTFVALAKYTFEQETPVNLRLQETRLPQ